MTVYYILWQGTQAKELEKKLEDTERVLSDYQKEAEERESRDISGSTAEPAAPPMAVSIKICNSKMGF